MQADSTSALRAIGHVWCDLFPARSPDALPATPPPPATPSLLIVSLPKSGTVYLNSLFRKGLNLENTQLCNGYFPADVVALERLRRFVERGGLIAATHLPASAVNLQLLDALLPRWVVHVRDPRSSLLSWVHHVRRLWTEGHGEPLRQVTPSPPEPVLGSALGTCIDWHIEHYYRAAVAWTEAWVAAADARGGKRVLLTEFAALRQDEAALCRRIAAFAGFDPALYQHQPPEKTMAAHFRRGELAEWAQVFTPAQIAHTSAMIPPALSKRFGWPIGGSAAP